MSKEKRERRKLTEKIVVRAVMDVRADAPRTETFAHAYGYLSWLNAWARQVLPANAQASPYAEAIQMSPHHELQPQLFQV